MSMSTEKKTPKMKRKMDELAIIPQMKKYLMI